MLAVVAAAVTVVAAATALGRRPGAADGPAVVSASWRLADRAVIAAGPRWSAGHGYGAAAKLNEQLLIVHAEAALVGHHGATRQDARIAPLVDLLTRGRWVPTLDGQRIARRTKTDFSCAPGWSSSDRAVNMHPSTTALVATALAAAWRVRGRVGLSSPLRTRIRRQLLRVAGSSCWRSPARGLRGINQVNWSADVLAAAATVASRPAPLWEDYRRQLVRFTGDADRPAHVGGSPNFSAGLGFRYEAREPPGATVNATDTVEYSNIVFSVLAHHDRARAAGMRPLPASSVAVLRRWARHLLHGTWAPSGYLNWDSGKGPSRLHVTQYWLYAAASFVGGLAGSRSLQLVPDQLAVAADLRRRTVALFRRRARTRGSLRLAATSYGLRSSQMGGPGDEKAIIGVRFADLLGRFAALDHRTGTPRSRGAIGGFSDDRQLARTVVATPRYSAALLGASPFVPSGGLEPARVLDADARPVTGIGGQGSGALGLVLASGGRPILDTQSPLSGQRRSAPQVSAGLADRAGGLGDGLDAWGTAAAPGVVVEVRHRFLRDRILTHYRIVNEGDPLLAVLRVPTYGSAPGERPADGGPDRRSRVVDRRAGAVVLRLRGLDGARFTVTLAGTGARPAIAVGRPSPQPLNPRPGPQITVGLSIGPGETILRRTLLIGRS